MAKNAENFNINIRTAGEEDIAIILQLVSELAEYERLSHKITATSDHFREFGFGAEKYFRAIIAEYGIEEELRVSGFALYFFTFSTFLGQPTLYLEDLFVKPQYRGNGIGLALLKELAKIAVQKKCGRMEWSVLDWNKPAIKFYEALGARALSDWTVFRLEESGIKKLSQLKTENREADE
ncbi:MAG: GNAT family N-acetyltransferase [Calditrichia bacterium]